MPPRMGERREEQGEMRERVCPFILDLAKPPFMWNVTDTSALKVLEIQPFSDRR